MPRSFIQRKRKRRGISEGAEKDGQTSAEESNKVSRFYGLIEGITIKVHCSPTRQPYNLGCFHISSLKDEIESPTEISMKFDPDGICFILLQENEDSVITVHEGTFNGVPYDILQLLTSLNIFYFYLHSSKLVQEFDVEIYFDPSKFVQLEEPSAPVYNRHKSKMFEILQFFLGIQFEVYDGEIPCEGNEIPKVYSCIQNSYNPELGSEFSHEAFKPELRPYQCQAVSWMLEREKGNFSEDELHPLFIPITLKDGHTLYFHKFAGFFVSKKYAPDRPCRGGLLADEMGLGKTLEVLACILMNPRPMMERENSNVNPQEMPQNGILSDTSLDIEQEEIEDKEDLANIFGCQCGKISTCDFIAKCKKCKIMQHPTCMFNNPKNNQDYICPHCLVKEPVISSRATLIVSPSSIILQWLREINTHINDGYLKVFLYRGVRTDTYVHQQDLADYDIVLVSYETLQKEIVHLDAGCGRDSHSLRNSKRFISIPSPLTTIEWWRICLDEAQMFETGHLKIAMMLAEVNSINRWCVTGTPVKRGVDDMYSLFFLLDAKPFNEKVWFKEGIKTPFKHGNHEPLCSSLKSIAWGTRKYQVLDQIGLIEVKEVTEILKFSPVEKFHYENDAAKYIKAFLDNLETSTHILDMDLRRISKSLLHSIISPLKELTKTCCHFQIGHESLDRTQHVMMSTTELLNKLLKTKTYECEQIHRQFIMASSALAGIHIIEGDYTKAVELYKKSLQSIEDSKKYIRTDVTQQIHNLFHLSNTLKSTEKEGKLVECELKPSELDEKVEQLSKTWLEKSRIELSHCTEVHGTILSLMQEDYRAIKLKKYNYHTSYWWSTLTEVSEDLYNAHSDRLHDVLEKAFSGSSTSFMDCDIHRRLAPQKVSAFLTIILTWSNRLHCERRELLDMMEDLKQEPDDVTVQSAIYCHLRPVAGSRKCKYCKADDAFKRYETNLYIIEETTLVKHLENNATEEVVTRTRKHHFGPLEICLDHVLKCLVQSFKDTQLKLHEEAIHDGYVDIRLMQGFKKEFQVLRNTWKRYYDFVSHKDQIEMAKIGMTLIPENQHRPESTSSYCVYPHEIISKKIQFQSDAMSSQAQLRVKFGQYHYLKNLEKHENKNAPFEELCPICQTKMETTWYVLECGHCLCVTCTQQLLDIRRVVKNGTFLTSCRGLTCPYCREFSSSTSLNIIGSENEEANNEIPLKRFYSTKLNAVVRCLLKIQKEERGAKSLVFSSFPGILQILADAFTENKISFVKLTNGGQNLLNDFRLRLIEACLIPLNDSYSGLNITEANHVLFVEPIINTSLQLQAIGRAHRFGQKRQVTVHRFIIKSTIEEAIHAAASTSRDGETMLKLRDLQNLWNT